MIDENNMQEIIFDISQYDFHARFWNDVNSYEVFKIVSINNSDGQSGEVIYYVTNFKAFKTKPEDSVFLVSNRKDIKVKEFSTGGPVVGQMAPAWSLMSLDSSEVFSLKNLKGDIMVMDFWATWCKPCIEAKPKINQLNVEFKNNPINLSALLTTIMAIHWNM